MALLDLPGQRYRDTRVKPGPFTQKGLKTAKTAVLTPFMLQKGIKQLKTAVFGPFTRKRHYYREVLRGLWAGG